MSNRSRLGKNLVEQTKKALQLNGIHVDDPYYKEQVAKAQIEVDKARAVSKAWYQRNKERRKKYYEEKVKADPHYHAKRRKIQDDYRERRRLKTKEDALGHLKVELRVLNAAVRKKLWSPSYRRRKEREDAVNTTLRNWQHHVNEMLYNDWHVNRNFAIHWQRTYVDAVNLDCEGNPYSLFPRRPLPGNFDPRELQAPLLPQHKMEKCPHLTLHRQARERRGQLTGPRTKTRE